jgi:hypothetical protein
MWQAIKNVGVQAGDATVADLFRNIARQGIALLAPDGLLDQGVKVLHPDRSAVHPRRRQRVQPGIVNLVRVDLDREFAVLGHRGHGKDRLGQLFIKGRATKRGRPAPPMQAA